MNCFHRLTCRMKRLPSFFGFCNDGAAVQRFICECVKARGNVDWPGGSVMLSVLPSVFALAA